MLLNQGQGHLFEHWPELGVDDDKKKSFFDQVCLRCIRAISQPHVFVEFVPRT
jgi:hypothetical protein